MRRRVADDLHRLVRVSVAIVAAWFVEVMALIVLKAVFGIDPAYVSMAVAAPGTAVNALINTVLLLVPEFVLARALYRRWAAPR